MGAFKTTPIERVKSLTKEEFIEKYYKPQKPVLIEDLTKSWDAYQKWNLDYIKQLAGDQEVPLYNNQVTKGKQKSAEPAMTMKMSEYIDIIKSKPTDLRIFFFDLMKKMPELAKDFSFPDIGLKFFKRLPVMFFGSTGSNVLVHYDMDLADLIHVHFHGTKSVLLFNPEQTKYLYRVPFSVHNLETIDMDNPDFETYPALKKVHGITAEMKHGDALYIPSSYWHYIKYLNGGFSMTLRAFSKNPLVFLNMLYNLLFMRHFENLMRKTFGQKWLNFKDKKAIKNTHRALAKAS
ncbi:cupin-like domain-containing protein [Seonamhaeicola marinus]|uniref:Cupin-like domain-containing protein n=1 Tax=Seonamhaeicola marinus TaxID=1912246 RepID=A0A5D0HRJ7_9FLAO|nr:cupin-like domain-containing protein [Seonamhaeicola marinus]TYA73966.1 cupin-like domain-containing protein [Seonamhaeicola marinus]